MIDLDDLATGDKVTIALVRKVSETGRPLVVDRRGLGPVVFVPLERGDLPDSQDATEAATAVLEAWGLCPGRDWFHAQPMALRDFAEDPEKTLRHVLDEHLPALALVDDNEGLPVGVAVAVAVSHQDLEDFTMAHAPECRAAMDEADAGLGSSTPWAEVPAELLDG